MTSGNRYAQIIAKANLVDGTMKNSSGEFVIKNPNNKLLEFSLVDEAFAVTDAVVNQNAVNTVWTLTLELTPIEDNPNHYKLRNGL